MPKFSFISKDWSQNLPVLILALPKKSLKLFPRWYAMQWCATRSVAALCCSVSSFVCAAVLSVLWRPLVFCVVLCCIHRGHLA